MPEKLECLKITKCNQEVRSKTIQPHARSKDLQTQNIQVCVLEVIGVISSIIRYLI